MSLRVCVSGLVFRNNMGLYVKDAHVCCDSVEHCELHVGMTMTTDMRYRFINNMRFLPFDRSLKLEKYILRCLLVDDSCDLVYSTLMPLLLHIKEPQLGPCNHFYMITFAHIYS